MKTYKAAACLADGHKREGGGVTGSGIFVLGPVTQNAIFNLTVLLNFQLFPTFFKL